MSPKRIRLKIDEIEIRPLRLPLKPKSAAGPQPAPPELKQGQAVTASAEDGARKGKAAGAPAPRAGVKGKKSLWGLGAGSVLLVLLAFWWLMPPTTKDPGPVAFSGKERRASAHTRGAINPVNTLWVLTIGISDYGDHKLNLAFADHDAQRIGEMLRKQQPGLFHKVETTCLVNHKADRESILIAAENIAKRIRPEDVVFIFVAGHGILDKVQKEYYFLPYGANLENFFTKGLRWSEFVGIVKILSARVKNLILAVDTCHAGATARADLASELKIDSGYILSASKASEASVEDQSFRLPQEKRGHGAFTYALLRGLAGEADMYGDGLINVEELFAYMARTIPELTKGKQHPYRVVSGTETIIIAIKE